MGALGATGVVGAQGDEPAGDCEGLSDGTPREIVERFVCDVDGDGRYMDVTGDGAVTNADVTEFFRNQHAPPWSERTDLFDFTGDGAVSQADVVELFEYVAQ